ncbi:uncharacterized protein B0I36DRAFT_321889 [Microdochium trichocladiopsis]|uniref:DUF1254 domain-containing protein n=1 Tax=Microdochium trichocladiopsis TaxID=1682393 RepID=A0A9P8Y7N1_9PEZI|nr:uncharacterized protein B0I36DRAFT_321889 [Microdochium trichocladiopsis]KAH7033690.1 hypothetical protein B0I36DRAFT_321889 [Microdochium trichocladiopsis]
MRWSAFFTASLASAAAVQQQQHHRRACSPAPPCTDVACVQNATNFAFVYGAPLYAAGTFVRAVPLAVTNFIYHQRNLATAAGVGVVRPNADTVYSGIFVDVSAADLEVTLPEIKDRYWVFPFYDLYGNNIGNIGSINNDTAGKYIIKYKPDDYGVKYDNVPDGYVAQINLAAPYGLVIQRILVTDDPDDIQKVRDIQDQIKTLVLPRLELPVAPPWILSMFSDPRYLASATNPLPLAILRLTAALAEWQQPIVAGDRPWVASLLKAAGIEHGVYTKPESANLTIAVAAANQSRQAYAAQPGAVKDMGHNWTIFNDVGNFLSHYVLRYIIAQVGYLILGPDQAIYPFYPNIDLPLGKAAILTFSAKPKITPGGFWSLTAYDSEGFLVKNSLNRYAVGDHRGNLTFPDGTPLSDAAVDGPFKILLQASNVNPPANWTSNWLPVSEAGGIAQVTLRWYGGEPIMNEVGGYDYPTLEIVDALQA